MPTLTFTASKQLRDAVELEAYEHDETLAAAVRRIVANYLRYQGKMSHMAAPSPHLHDHNPQYLDRGDA